MISIVAAALPAAVAAAEEGHESPSVLAVPLDELILGTIAFFIVFFALWKLALPNIAKTLEQRADAIEGGMQRAADAEAEAQALMAQYREQIAGAHEEAAEIRAKAEQDGKSIVAEARAQAESERATIAQRGVAQLAAERTQTLATLRSDVGGLAVDLAGRIVGETLTDDQRARAVVDRFIADLEQAGGPSLRQPQDDATSSGPSLRQAQDDATSSGPSLRQAQDDATSSGTGGGSGTDPSTGSGTDKA